jgi:ATP-dependent DNA ligase
MLIELLFSKRTIQMQVVGARIGVRTELVAQIEFTEWTPDEHLKHSKFVGLREDKGGGRGSARTW